MKELSKLQAERLHAKRRAMERLGFNLNKAARKELINRIQLGKLKFLYRQSVRVTVWRDNINGEDIDVVYDKARHCIITFLFPEEESFYEDNDKGKDSAEDQEGHNNLPLAPHQGQGHR